MLENLQLLRDAEEFQRALRRWYDQSHRKLPWRGAGASLYKTVVSEFMLQQTQVDTMLPYFARWLVLYPDFNNLAQAEEEEVVKAWEGLGYYSRARNLHKLAREYSQSDKKPENKEDWMKYKGVGDYTSAAIASIGMNLPHAVVDGNVIRILARLANVREEFKDNGVAMKAFKGIADGLLDREDPGTHNQAMMELGAMICVKGKPRCEKCPVFQFCQGVKAGDVGTLPKMVKKEMKEKLVKRVIGVEDGKVMMYKISGGAKRLANIYEIPEVTQSNGKLWGVKRRGISNERIVEEIYEEEGFRYPTEEGHQWIPLKDVASLTLSGPHRRWFNEWFQAKF